MHTTHTLILNTSAIILMPNQFDIINRFFKGLLDIRGICSQIQNPNLSLHYYYL